MKSRELLNKIEDLLEKKHQAYPERGEIFNELVKTANEYFEYLWESNDFVNWKPDFQKTGKLDSFIDKPVFICGNMKSGTTLLLTLLDGSDQMLVLPGDSYLIYWAGEIGRKSAKEVISRWFFKMISPAGQKPFWFLGRNEKDYRDLLYYSRYFLEETKLGISSFPAAVFCAHPNPPENIRYWVEKTPHNEGRIRQILKLYPEARFINILRDPLENITSLKRFSKFREWEREAFVRRKVSAIKMNFKFASDNLKKLGSQKYKIIKYEDLTGDCRTVMKGVCGFLGLEYRNIFSVPTVNGEPAVSNSIYKERRVSGEVKDSSGEKKWINSLSEKEKEFIASAVYKEVVGFGYDWTLPGIKKYRKIFLEKIFDLKMIINKIRWLKKQK